MRNCRTDQLVLVIIALISAYRKIEVYSGWIALDTDQTQND